MNPSGIEAMFIMRSKPIRAKMKRVKGPVPTWADAIQFATCTEPTLWWTEGHSCGQRARKRTPKLKIPDNNRCFLFMGVMPKELFL